MIFVIFFMSAVLYCRSATSTCTENFSCPNMLPFKYPFYNSTDPSSCGLIKVKCTSYGGEFQFGGHSYPITYKLDSDSSFFIRNYTFETQVNNRSCEALMNNFTSPSPLLFSFSINSHINIFKCPKEVSYSQEYDAYFELRNYYSYNKSCRNHNFYYKLPRNDTSVPSDLPHTCKVIQLPMKEQWQDVDNLPRNETDIFSLLSSDLSISFPLSPTCDKCFKNGSHCNTTHNGNVQCLHLQNVPAAKHGTQLTLILVLAGSAFILMLCPVIFIIQRWYRSNPFSSYSSRYNVNAETFLKNHDFLAPKRYSYSQVQKMTNSFKVKLGQGGFGSVYKGALTNELVAVKILSEVKDDEEDFINEVASIGRTSHVNVVRLVGFCLEGRRRALVYEFMPNGSLEKFIYKQQSSSYGQLGWEKLHQIAIGIARGLEYLHKGCNTRILHFDIKPHNILLDQDLCPKISDFGLAKLFHEKRSMISMSHMRGTPGYIAPELFSRNFGQVSHKSDVYSYGMMILEMVGGRKNVEVEVDHTSEIYFPHWIYKKIELDEQLGLHGVVSDSQDVMARKMIIVGLWCIQTNPLTRPTITKVLEMLEGDLASLEIPPKPYLSSPPRSTFTD